MCYNDAAAQSKAGIRALQHGIVVLLIPALVLFVAVFAGAYRRRDQASAESTEEETAQAAARRTLV